MYNMRYHLASLIAVFLALTIGLILGGLISERAPETVHETLLENIERDIAQTREANTQLREANVIAFDFADMLLDDFLADRLEGETVLVLGSGNSGADLATEAITAAGAQTIHAVPEFDEEAQSWTIVSEQNLDVVEFSGIVNTFVPTGEGGEYLSDYMVYLRSVQEYYDVSLIFATIDDESNDLIVFAQEEGFSGTNQLGNRYGTYALVVLLGSDTTGKFGSGDTADGLYPPVPLTWMDEDAEEIEEAEQSSPDQ